MGPFFAVCRIEFDGGSEEGFKCVDEYNWCIPIEHACNSLQNCPGGDDEDDVLCTFTQQGQSEPPKLNTIRPVLGQCWPALSQHCLDIPCLLAI